MRAEQPFAAPPSVIPEQQRYRQDFNTATYDHVSENPFLAAASNPLSTFSIDVDTASYSNVRRFINVGCAPAKGCGARGGDDELFHLRLSAADRRRSVLDQSRQHELSMGAGASPGANRVEGTRSRERQSAIEQSRFPSRCFRFDDAAGTAAVGEAGDAIARRKADGERPGRDRRLRRRIGFGAAIDDR